MKNFTFLLLLFIPFLSSTLIAQDSGIGIIDLEMIFQNTSAGKATMQEVKEIETEKRKNLEQLMQSYQDKEKEVQAKTTSQSVEAQQKEMFELQKLEAEINRSSENIDREMEEVRKKKLRDLEKKIRPVVEAVASEKAISIVLRQTDDSNIFYFDKAVDITSAVIKQMEGDN